MVENRKMDFYLVVGFMPFTHGKSVRSTRQVHSCACM